MGGTASLYGQGDWTGDQTAHPPEKKGLFVGTRHPMVNAGGNFACR